MKTVLIVGLGSFGTSFAEKMTELGNEVRLVDLDENAIESMPSEYENSARSLPSSRHLRTRSHIGTFLSQSTLLLM